MSDPFASIRGKFPGWECWTGVTGLLYVRRIKSSPPAVFRGRDAAELVSQIKAWEYEHDRVSHKSGSSSPLVSNTGSRWAPDPAS